MLHFCTDTIVANTHAGRIYGYYYYNDDNQYNCDMHHTSLSQCTKTSDSQNCGTYDKALGLICDTGIHACPYSC